MNKYKLQIVLDVEIEAFDKDDAKDVAEDVFGPGNDCGVEILSMSIKELHDSDSGRYHHLRPSGRL